ncbi:AAA family ATPase [Orbus wheelerorum]|uniref:AAA family ATPase n=1 Tax=Orbus wheelerorum TaxID=3074111 RepID=UPI00370D59BE
MTKKAKVITIADTNSGSTKSTTAVNVVAFTASSGLKTLLLDFDLEQPTSCSYFPLQNEVPFSVYEF